MPQVNITVKGNSDMELITRKTAIEAVNALSTDELKRVQKLIKSPKAKKYLSSDIQFAVLNQFL
jgi:hypothetical protein